MSVLQRRVVQVVCGALLSAAFAPAIIAKPLDIPVVYDTLPNGLRVVISEDHSAPVVTVGVYYGVGFRVEPQDRTGFAHLFEHMMFQGSANVKKFEHAKYVEANGGDLNGSTRLDFTNYYENLPSDRTELALWLEADRMTTLAVTAENLKNQQNVVSEEVRVNVLNQPYALFFWLDLWMNAFTNWHNSHNFYGDLTEIEAATVADCQTFYKTFYAPNNAAVVVVGDVQAADVRKMVTKYFGGIPAGPALPKYDLSEKPQTAEKRVSQTDKLANLPGLAIGYRIPEPSAPDYAAVVLLNRILQGDDSSRLYQKLVKEKEICVSWQSGINFLIGNEFNYNGPMLASTFAIYKPGHTADEILKEVDAATSEIAAKGVGEKELADAKVQFRSYFYDLIGTNFGKADMLASFALFRNDPAYIRTALEPFDKVTAADIQAAARKYYVPTNRTSVDRVPEAKGGAK
ncbi:MAG TPA: pitrilysin family protein [Blastocatellia bacterium]|nr:pitrilysin family protein [Blastocatellia bacterium]